MKTEVNPPTQVDLTTYEKFIFLAGSIEMDKAEMWQERVIDLIKDDGVWEICIFNPRRRDWDSSWEQTIKNPHFKEQVNWELNSIEHSDTILFYFQPNTKSPISLLELGMCSNYVDKKIIVCCPDGFWRKGNVDIMCERMDIPVYTDLEEAVKAI
jgi:hypothetical protein